MKILWLNILLYACIKSIFCTMPQNAVFVHVGKTGGTSARKSFFSTFKQSSLKTGYVHGQKPDVEKFDTFIVTIRNPIDRMISWFLYAHPKNEIIVKRSTPTHTEIFDCYEQINDLATNGLDQTPKELNDCQYLARNLISGIGHDSKELIHIVRNYKFYTSELLSQSKHKNIYVLRTDHLNDDWVNTAKDLIKRTGISAEIHEEVAHFTHRKGKNPVVTSEHISKKGIKNACFFLCPEIQLYKKLLNKAINLNATDRSESLKDLAKYCPKEAKSQICPSIKDISAV